jgi:hypothetical protein
MVRFVPKLAQDEERQTAPPREDTGEAGRRRAELEVETATTCYTRLAHRGFTCNEFPAPHRSSFGRTHL